VRAGIGRSLPPRGMGGPAWCMHAARHSCSEADADDPDSPALPALPRHPLAQLSRASPWRRAASACGIRGVRDKSKLAACPGARVVVSPCHRACAWSRHALCVASPCIVARRACLCHLACVQAFSLNCVHGLGLAGLKACRLASFHAACRFAGWLAGCFAGLP
jgi:hypothetical protein